MTDLLNSRGADAVVATLSAAGVDIVFSLSGNQIMPVYDALLGSGIRIVHSRHEGAAVYMAEAYAQVTGKPGVALLTAGPGFANGLSAAWGARCSETPVLILSGDSPMSRDGHGAFQEMDQLAFAAPATKASVRATSAAQIGADVRNGLALACQGRPGPVHLALPDDVLRQPADADAAASSAFSALLVQAATSERPDMAQILECLATSARPIVLAGPRFRRTDARRQLQQFTTQTGIPAVALESPRGLRDPRLGAFAEVLAKADLLVTLGKPLDFMTGFGEAPAVATECRIAQIDSDKDRLAADRARLGAVRDLVQLEAQPEDLMEAIAGATASAPAISAGWAAEVADATAYRPTEWIENARQSQRIHPVCVAAAVRPLLSERPDTVLVIDGGEFGQWSQACLDADTSLINGPSGAIGGGIAYAIAAKAARPDAPVIAMMGDGTAGFYLAEFETAIRNNLPFVAIIGNDAKWNAEHQIQVRDYGAQRAHSCELSPTRFDDVVRAMGGYGAYVTQPEQLAEALQDALASNRPACINVEIEGIAAPVVRREA